MDLLGQLEEVKLVTVEVVSLQVGVLLVRVKSVKRRMLVASTEDPEELTLDWGKLLPDCEFHGFGWHQDRFTSLLVSHDGIFIDIKETVPNGLGFKLFLVDALWNDSDKEKYQAGQTFKDCNDLCDIR